MTNLALMPADASQLHSPPKTSNLPETLLVIDTDIDLFGQTARNWLVVTANQVSVYEDGTSNGTTDNGPTEWADFENRKCLRVISWDEARDFRTQAGTGSGLLQAKLEQGWVDILRYSNRLAGRFHKVSRRLEFYRANNFGPEKVDATDLKTSQHEPSPNESNLSESSPDEPVEGWRENLDPPRCATCELRLTHKEDACPRCLHKGQILRRVSELLRPHLRGAVFLTVLTIIGVTAELIPPKLQQYMVDNILGERAATLDSTSFTTALLVVVLGLAFSRVLLSAVGWIKGRVATVIGTSLTSALREQMVRKLQQLAIVYFDRHQVGSTLSRVAHDSEVLHGMMHQITGGFLLQTVQLFGVGAMLLWLNPKLAMYTLIPVPLVFLGSWVFWQKVYPRYYQLWDASSKQMSVLNGMLSGIRVVKAFAQEDREFNRFQTASDHLRNWRLWVDQTNASYSAAMQLVFSLGGLIVWYVGGRDVIGYQMTLGELIAFLAYLAMFYAPLSALSNFTTWLTSFLSGSKRVLELLDMPLTIAEPAQPVDWAEPRGAIRFNKVTFGYDRNQPVLKDISFEVAPGEMIGIVGRSGSGKTTMVNLLGRFYDVQEGSIEVDGIDLRQLSMQQLRQRIGFVFQDSFLFRGTVWKNLSYGRPGTTIEEGLQAARAAGAHDFICRTQLAYETLLGEHGAGLSGGEKQRLSIARTLLYSPQILVLDEATSNIDAESERSIQEALEVLIQGRTTVAIAHRLSTLRNADRILVFDRGEMVEHGTHAELLRADGVYARLVRIQTQVSKTDNVDRLLITTETGAATSENENKDADAKNLNDSADLKTATNKPQEQEVKKYTAAIRWLDPKQHSFQIGCYDELELWEEGQRLGSGLFVVCTFPARHPTQYLSVRGWEGTEEIELGMIRDLDQWPAESAKPIREVLERRYLMPEITTIHNINLRYGFLDFDVTTGNQQRTQFAMRWTQSQAVDFGEHGKLLIDTEENRYLVRDVNSLPKPQAEKFTQHVYW